MPTINNTLPRIIRMSLQGIRLPLTALELVTNKSDNASWPPAVAFESFEAEMKKILGSLTRDEDLVREGMLQSAKIQELAEAERLEAVAEQKRLEADAKLEASKEAAKEAETRVEDNAHQREQQLSQEKAERERKLRDERNQREAAAAKSAQLRDKVVTAQERQADRTRIKEESSALNKRSEALSASKKVMDLDDALKAKKAQRKTG